MIQGQTFLQCSWFCYFFFSILKVYLFLFLCVCLYILSVFCLCIRNQFGTHRGRKRSLDLLELWMVWLTMLSVGNWILVPVKGVIHFNLWVTSIQPLILSLNVLPFASIFQSYVSIHIHILHAPDPESWRTPGVIHIILQYEGSCTFA